MVACGQKPADKRSFGRAVGSDLAERHGKKRYYTPDQVRASATRLGYPIDRHCWAMCLYTNPVMPTPRSAASWLAIAALVLCACGSSSSSFDPADFELGGTWRGAFVFPDGDAGEVELTFPADGGLGAGSYGGPTNPRPILASFRRDAPASSDVAIAWNLDEPRTPGLLITFEFRGTLRGPDRMVGSFAVTYTPDDRADLTLGRVE